MYERSAIVLERYFENLLDYRRECNLRDNFYNYCKLVEKLEKYQVNFQKEVVATQEFRDSMNKVKAVQAAQEKLYKKSAKLEYNRNLLFGNIEGKVEETRKCIEKIEAEVEKNNEDMKENKENLISALTEYNEKRFELSKCKRYKKMAENDYNEILEQSKVNFDGIDHETIENAKSFAKFDDIDDIIDCLDKNGKDEKIPFNEGVISSATKFGVEIAKNEAAGYILVYDKMDKLLTDIRTGTAKIELHKKYLRNEKAKMDFLLSVKEYIVQFLDYERMTVIYGRKSHNRLMSEACENFDADVVQINNLYELLLKEIANKATKKAYKELYNKSYLIDIQEKEEKFKKEKSRVNLNTATLINSNYWRIEGIKSIYTIFYKNVFEVFGRDVAEFDLPRELTEEDNNEDSDAEIEDIQDNKIEDITINAPVAEIPFEIDDLLNGEQSEDDDENEEYELKVTKSKVNKVFTDNSLKDSEEDDEDDNDAIINENEDDEDEEDEENDEQDDENFEDEEESDDVEYNQNKVYDDIIDNVVEELQEGTEEEFDIFGEKYREIDFSESNILEFEKKAETKENDIKIKAEEYDIKNGKIEEDIIPYESENEEEDLFADIKEVKRKKTNKNSKSNSIEDFPPEKEETPKTLFKKIRKVNGIKKKNTETNIW